MFEWLHGQRDTPPSYEDAKAISTCDDVEARRDLAAVSDLFPELLYYLATDENPEVRRAVAGNDSAPLKARIILSNDENKEVREKLASQIGHLVPELDKDVSSRTSQMLIHIMESLADDQDAEIRSILSDEIKNNTNIPPEMASKLANDVDITVASPVLEYSPLLNDQALISIIAGATQDGAIEAIARRKGLNENVSQAVVETESGTGVQILLENQTANISENTLTLISEKADTHENWHGPLVSREHLPEKAMQNIVKYVATNFVNQMIEKHNIPHEVVKDLRRTVFRRLNASPGPAEKRYAETRVLLVEPDAHERLRIENVLTEMGFVDIRVAGDGEIAERIFEVEHTPVKLLICSDELDDMSALELLEGVREYEESLPFILLSEKKAVDSFVEAIQAGVDEYMIKPISVAEFVRCIEHVFSQNVH